MAALEIEHGFEPPENLSLPRHRRYRILRVFGTFGATATFVLALWIYTAITTAAVNISIGPSGRREWARLSIRRTEFAAKYIVPEKPAYDHNGTQGPDDHRSLDQGN